MYDKPLYDNESEKTLHYHAIAILQREFGVPEDEVLRLYERELEKLKEHAKIKDYLVVLVYHSVKEILRRNMPDEERRNGTTG